MDRYAVIDPSGKVINVIAWDGQAKWSPPEGHTVKKSEECGIGDIWVDAIQDFARPMSVLKPPENEETIAERKAIYEQAKSELKSSMLFLNLEGQPEA